MTVYAVGDLQGCRPEFDHLLEVLQFGSDDRLWLVGDLINRGSDSLGTLRRVYAMREQCSVVLGNHDLHFLAMIYGGHRPRSTDTFDELLDAPDLQELVDWLVSRPLLHRDDALGFVMAHAGVPHIWGLAQAEALAAEVHSALCDRHEDVSREEFFAGMYGNDPDLWHDDLRGLPRLRLITNYFTRMRLITADGRLDFAHKGPLSDAPPGWKAWYEYFDYQQFGHELVFGHWAALDGVVSNRHVHALDTGCVWGRSLTAMNLTNGDRFSVSALQ